jgi:hypothetical protein
MKFEYEDEPRVNTQRGLTVSITENDGLCLVAEFVRMSATVAISNCSWNFQRAPSSRRRVGEPNETQVDTTTIRTAARGYARV